MAIQINVPPYIPPPVTWEELEYADLPVIDSESTKDQVSATFSAQSGMQKERIFGIVDVAFTGVSEEKRLYEGSMEKTGSPCRCLQGTAIDVHACTRHSLRVVERQRVVHGSWDGFGVTSGDCRSSSSHAAKRPNAMTLRLSTEDDNRLLFLRFGPDDDRQSVDDLTYSLALNLSAYATTGACVLERKWCHAWGLMGNWTSHDGSSTKDLSARRAWRRPFSTVIILRSPILTHRRPQKNPSQNDET
ncbi:hypothetical protein EDD18DRAFT_1100531 [Armillaria luteobubalina]|uniref:Uncharacterized protein n=1 Tax=Armillaria luteobubalina TaxID=153913 RepID=A0AA39UT40_9AGAR|nr:hypothetical protein EDD18DRAFT_1100531 [Armillaria luteobubalina]